MWGAAGSGGSEAGHAHHHGQPMRSQRLVFAPRVRFDATVGEVNLAPQPGLTDNRLVLIGEYELERQTLEQRIMTAALPV